MDRAPSRAHERQQVTLLSVCYALSLSTISLNIAAAPLVGLELASDARLATLPLSLAVVGMMFAGLPASLLMGRIGRRAGHIVGTLIGTIGAAVAVAGIVRGSFWLFCAGTIGIGIVNSFTQLFRFAAADVAPGWHERAISYVLAGGVAAGVIGPWLAVRGVDLTPVAFAGTYILVAILYAAVAILLLLLDVPPMQSGDGTAQATPVAAILRLPGFAFAVLAAMLAYGLMALLMTATPLSMRAAGFDLQVSARVIQVHVVAMFLPSFWTGRLIARHGARRIMAIGGGALALTFVAALAGQSVVHFAIALALLGVGWNFLFTAATTLLARLARPAAKAKVQGVNDLLVFGTAAVGSLAAGAAVAGIGWTSMLLVALPVASAIALLLLRAGRTVPAAPAPA